MFNPGNLVHARGRDWVVQSGSSNELLSLRPLTGSSDSLTYLVPSLEVEPIREASFPYPNASKMGNFEDSSIFRNAVMLRLRDGAGPLRCLGHIAVEPRSFQLTPLLMALKMDTIRLLIADDVGVGKTIEAGLVAREMLDRFEIERISVLCPPHLVDQWVKELSEHFNLPAVALTSSTVYSLEKKLPSGISLTQYYPVTVVSLDYIKNPNRQDNFVQTAPEFIIVDEAHTCTEKNGKTNQLRFNLLRELSSKADRHMLFLTATPHSGDNIAFGNLLSLIDPKFAILGSVDAMEIEEYKALRENLALHLVQRQRKDVLQFQDKPNFAKRLQNEFQYTLNGEWKEFFEDVREYCAKLGEKYSKDRNSAIWYAILALYRSIASSPASAIKALDTRIRNVVEEENEDADLEESMRILMDTNSSDVAADVDTTSLFKHDKALKDLLEKAKILQELEDPKFSLLLKVLKEHFLKPDEYLHEPYCPIIFCKYIATANYVATKLKEVLPKEKYHVEVITGQQSPEERQERVAKMSKEDFPILVATDCLSEGINLQEQFNAVIHYDLAWNPTRHEQREGRVDRFGQVSPYVKCVMIYGKDNPVDGLILNVILRKAKTIRDSLGVVVPVPDDSRAIQSALIQATMLKRKSSLPNQLEFDFGEIEDLQENLNKPWEDALEKAKLSRTIFAQRAIHTDDVYALLTKEKLILGTENDVEDFVLRVLSRLHVRPEKTNKGYVLCLQDIVDSNLRTYLKEAGIADKMKVSFYYPPASGYSYVHRSHPLVETLSSFTFEYNMEDSSTRDYDLGTRCAVTETKDVSEIVYLFMIRIRMQINVAGHSSMAEETLLLKNEGSKLVVMEDSKDYKKYLNVIPSSNLATSYKERMIDSAIRLYDNNRQALEEILLQRAQVLFEENNKIRMASSKGSFGRISVVPCNDIDLLGSYVLIPSGEDL